MRTGKSKRFKNGDKAWLHGERVTVAQGSFTGDDNLCVLHNGAVVPHAALDPRNESGTPPAKIKAYPIGTRRRKTKPASDEKTCAKCGKEYAETFGHDCKPALVFKVWLEIEEYNEKTGEGRTLDAPGPALKEFKTYASARKFAQLITDFVVQ